MTNEELRQLAAQLRQPSGEDGLKTAELMRDTNASMIRHAISQLELKNNDFVLELGHAAGAHVSWLFDMCPGIQYTGLEISPLMHEEATKNNSTHIQNNRASFHLYGGSNIPFEANTFHKIFSVNTIYFWDNPIEMAAELARVLQPGGLLCITFGEEAYMKHMPFTAYGFTLYNTHQVTDLFALAGLTLIHSPSANEVIKSKTGEEITRQYTTAVFTK
ncbi:MAG: class I SAM-dependent methyltransferase [Chitinophagales bacterium]|nr:class I SAM-dependent methyltransferase [Chitinophagales bacterium]